MTNNWGAWGVVAGEGQEVGMWLQHGQWLIRKEQLVSGHKQPYTHLWSWEKGWVFRAVPFRKEKIWKGSSRNGGLGKEGGIEKPRMQIQHQRVKSPGAVLVALSPSPRYGRAGRPNRWVPGRRFLPSRLTEASSVPITACHPAQHSHR